MLHHAAKAPYRPHRLYVVMTKHITDKVFTITCLDRKVKPCVDCYMDIYGEI